MKWMPFIKEIKLFDIIRGESDFRSDVSSLWSKELHRMENQVTLSFWTLESVKVRDS